MRPESYLILMQSTQRCVGFFLILVGVFDHKMNTAQLNAITIVFDAEISQVEIPFLRSAVSSSITSGNYLFHNHLGGAICDIPIL